MITGVMMRPFSDSIQGDEGDRWFIFWLERNGFTDVKRTDQYCRWDLEGYYKGDKFCFEMKNRTFPSFTYGDVFLNKDKYDYLKDLPYRAVLVTFYTDKFVLIDLKNRRPQEVTEQKCRRQTVFDDHRMIQKKVVKWFIKDLKLLDYD